MWAALESFALDGLTLPAFNIAFGAWLVLMAPHRKDPSAEDLAVVHPVVRYMATRRNIERPVGIFMIAVGILIAVLRLTR